MKYICFGYLDVENWAKLSAGEQDAMIDQCFAYDDVLKKNGNWVSGEGLQGATTLSYQNGKVSVTDGPYAETKEVLGGLLIIEARDVNNATPRAGYGPDDPRKRAAPFGRLSPGLNDFRREAAA